jgi:hypothetical protein
MILSSNDPIGYLFVAGCSVSLICGIRLFLRLSKVFDAATRPKGLRRDPLTEFVLRMELRDTVGLEVLGLIVGGLVTVISLQFLK